jgi:dTDP-4-dehydrorhamnose reductase
MSAIPTTTIPSTNGATFHLILTGASGYLGQHLLSHWIEFGVLPPSSSSSSADGDIKFKISALYHKSESFPKAVNAFRRKIPQQHPGISEIAARSIDLTDPSDIESLVQAVSSSSAVPSQVDDGSEEAGSSSSSVTIIIVHAAALSSPRVCQETPEVARAINVPTKFFDAFLGSSFTKRNTKTTTAILALSTDQVYDGRQEEGSYYKENEEEGLNPINVYGQTKLEMERYLLQQQQQQSSSSSERHRSLLVALRSSIIMGPKAPIDPECAHGTFLDFCKSRGQAKEPTIFFTNEYRSVVRVDRVLQTIGGFVSRIVTAKCPRACSSVVYNLGGPVRVNRMELAGAVFDKFGYDRSLLLNAEQTSPLSPLDISMDSSLLLEEGILQGEDNDTEKGHSRQDSETYSKDLVDYVFGVE